MEENQNAVVNGVETTTHTDSAPVETNSQSINETSTTQEGISSSETQNTSTQPQNSTTQAVPYERFREVNEKAKTLQAEMESLRSKAELLDKLQQDPDLARSVLKNVNFAKEETKPVDPQVQQAMEVLKDAGFMTREEFARELQAIEQGKAQQQVEQHVIESFQSQVAELSKKYDGSDGSPAFNAEAVADYMDNNGIIWGADGKPDVEVVHFILNREALIDAQAKKIRSSTYTEKAGSTSATPDNADSLINEARQKGDFSNVFKTFLKK